MTDATRRDLTLLKNMLIKIGKLLLERSEKVGPEKWKERQEKVRMMRKGRVTTRLLRTGSQEL